MNGRSIARGLTELSIIALTTSVAFGLDRLFSDRSFLTDVVALLVASHLLAMLVRRSGFGMGVSALVSAIGFLMAANVALYPETAGTIVPTSHTIELLRTDLDVAWRMFSEDSAPVEPLRGLVLVASAALWWTAALADWAALRLQSKVEAVVPATTMFVFTVVIADGAGAVLHAGLFAACAGAVLLSVHLLRQSQQEVWVSSQLTAGLKTSLRLGVGATTLAVLVGTIVGPELPGAGEQLIDPSRWDEGPGPRRVTSPLVEVGASLVNQSQREMFSVAVDDPTDRHYWRQMALTEFNGNEWRRSSSFADARGPVDSDIADDIGRRSVRQRITTRTLGGIYLPAAYEVSNVVSSDGVDLEYEVETGALVIKRGSESDARGGFTYVIESAVPDYDPATLPTDATQGLESDFVAEHTQLPPLCLDGQSTADDCWNPRITDLAREITSQATSDYDRVLALQRFFIDPANFTYDINVALNHDVNSMEDFLFSVERGYCEQFASTFAAMARALGIPARVAVGFTWGEWSESRNEFVVKGEHAHAWPEVHFVDLGWVVLDPTPGRAPAQHTDLTRLAPAQLGENDASNRGLPPDSTPTTLPPRQGNTTSPEAPTPTAPPSPTTPDPTPAAVERPPDEAGWGSLQWSLVVMVTLAALTTSVPALRHLGRRRRHHQAAPDPLGRTELAWDEATDALRLVGLIPSPSETPNEFAARAMGQTEPLGPVDELAAAVTLLRYADLEDPIPVARAAQSASTEVVEACRSSTTTATRLSNAFDPRTIRMN